MAVCRARENSRSPAQTSPADEQLEGQHEGQGQQEDDDRKDRDRRATDLDLPGQGEDLGRGSVTRARQDECDVLKDEGHADGRDQGRDTRGVA